MTGPPRPPATDPADDLPADPLRHHGDRETGAGLLDFAVNVFAGPRPPWLETALHASLAEAAAYPSPAAAERALAIRHGRAPDQVLATAGAAEAFSLVARLRRWRRPVVVHPQFTEPHAALEQAGRTVDPLVLPQPFALDPEQVPDDADLVVVGNPTNPTGVLHDAVSLRRLLRPHRLVLVDEAFMDTVPGEVESLAGQTLPGLLVARSLTKQWGIPGVRAGYLLGPPALLDDLRRQQVPWSVSTTAAAAMVACSTAEAQEESARRARSVAAWRAALTAGLDEVGVAHLPSSTSFVLARLGDDRRRALRQRGVAVRRADTFPGLGRDWCRIAVRPPEVTALLLRALRDTGAPPARATGLDHPSGPAPPQRVISRRGRNAERPRGDVEV